MSFFSEIAAAANLSELKLSTGYSVVNYNGEAIYIEGIVRLLSIDPESIRLELRGAIAALSGKEMNIYELSDCAIIKGTVTNMEFTPVNNSKTKRGIRHSEKK